MNESSAERFYFESRMRDSYLAKRRSLMTTFIMTLVLTAIFSLVVFFAPPIRGILEKQEQILSAQLDGMKKVPNIEEKLSNIESKITVLTTKSIENRLSSIEKAIKIGDLKPDEISNIQDLRREIQVIKTYMFSDPRDLVELKELQSNYKNIMANQNIFATKELVLGETASIRNLLYLSLAFFGILFTILFGSRWYNVKRLKDEMKPTKPIKSKGKEEEEEAI